MSTTQQIPNVIEPGIYNLKRGRTTVCIEIESAIEAIDHPDTMKGGKHGARRGDGWMAVTYRYATGTHRNPHMLVIGRHELTKVNY